MVTRKAIYKNRYQAPKELRKHTWFCTLIDMYASILEDMALRNEDSVCKEGCAICCHQPIPLSTVEAMGIQLYRSWQNTQEISSEIKENKNKDIENKGVEGCGAENKNIDESIKVQSLGLSKTTNPNISLLYGTETGISYKDVQKPHEDTQPHPCQFLKTASCSIYPVRPIACRRYIIYRHTCLLGENPPDSRPQDVLNVSRMALYEAWNKLLPIYKDMKIAPREMTFDKNFFIQQTILIQDI